MALFKNTFIGSGKPSVIVPKDIFPSEHHSQKCLRESFILTDYSHIGGLGTLGALGHFKFNFIAFFKGFEALSLNGGVMDKHVLLALNFDKSKALSIVEPFNFSCHWNLH